MGPRARTTGSGGAHLCADAVSESTKAGGGADEVADDSFAFVFGIARRRRVDIVLSAGRSLDDGRVLLSDVVNANSGTLHKGIISYGIRGRGMGIGHWGLLVEAESVPENVQMQVVVMVVPHNCIAWWNGKVTLISVGRIAIS